MLPRLCIHAAASPQVADDYGQIIRVRRKKRLGFPRVWCAPAPCPLHHQRLPLPLLFCCCFSRSLAVIGWQAAAREFLPHHPACVWLTDRLRTQTDNLLVAVQNYRPSSTLLPPSAPSLWSLLILRRAPATYFPRLSFLQLHPQSIISISPSTIYCRFSGIPKRALGDKHLCSLLAHIEALGN